jgi:hypothetical protein
MSYTKLHFNIAITYLQKTKDKEGVKDMNLGSAFLQIENNKRNTVIIPATLLSNRSSCKQIAFGKKVVECQIETSNETTLQISSDLYSELNLPFEQQIHLFINGDTLHIGPLVGIFTAGFTGSNLRPIGERSLLFAKYLAAAKYAGVLPFVFGVHQINWKKKKIEGFFHTEKGWVKKNVPFPNVIYDRLPNRRTEKFPTIKKVKKRLIEKDNIPWFNPGFLDKWTIHELALKNEKLKSHFPQTILSPTIVNIQQILNQYESCYLKPANGSLGYGIYQIIKKDNLYYCRYRNRQENRLRRFTSLEKLIEVQFFEADLKTYICQQAINLQTYEGKPYDFRIHTNKDSQGNWIVSAIAAKVAGEGSVTTHISSGGQVKTIAELFTPTKLSNKITEQLEQFTLSLSEYLDQEIAGNIGEIGYDIGMDSDGQIWVFEANSKPGRSIFSHAALAQSELQTRTLPFQYCLYLLADSLQNEEIRVNPH